MMQVLGYGPIAIGEVNNMERIITGLGHSMAFSEVYCVDIPVLFWNLYGVKLLILKSTKFCIINGTV